MSANRQGINESSRLAPNLWRSGRSIHRSEERMNKFQASSTITASMLLIGLTLFISKGWATDFTTFVESKINDPKDPNKPTQWASGESGFSPDAGAGEGGGGGGGGSW